MFSIMIVKNRYILTPVSFCSYVHWELLKTYVCGLKNYQNIGDEHLRQCRKAYWPFRVLTVWKRRLFPIWSWLKEFIFELLLCSSWTFMKMHCGFSNVVIISCVNHHFLCYSMHNHSQNISLCVTPSTYVCFYKHIKCINKKSGLKMEKRQAQMQCSNDIWHRYILSSGNMANVLCSLLSKLTPFKVFCEVLRSMVFSHSIPLQ